MLSAQSVSVACAGPDLASGQLARWQMGLLAAADWTAQWISLPSGRPGIDQNQPPFLRHTFTLAKPLARATVYATARGVYALHLNGQRGGDEHFAPGWADYTKRLQYQTYDVTERMQDGENVTGAALSDGWDAGYIGWGSKRAYYGSRLQLLAQIVLEYTDGSRETLGTDDEWRGATGLILASDMLLGETYDARLEMPGWSACGFDDGR